MAIEVKNLEQLKSMRKAGLVVADTLELLKRSAQIGMTTLELDEIAATNLVKHGATSSFLGYHGFPAVICASVNEEVVHGMNDLLKSILEITKSQITGAFDIYTFWNIEERIVG